jgi:SOR/SNZ family
MRGGSVTHHPGSAARRLASAAGRPQRESFPMRDQATSRVTAGLAETLNGGVIIDVVTAEEANIAEDAGRSPTRRLSGCPRTTGAATTSPACPTRR